MALASYEINTDKEGTDVRPGDNLSIDWGISKYLTPLLEIGPSGYFLWQVGDDTGADAVNPTVHGRVFGTGLQVGYQISLKLIFTGIVMWEYAAIARPQGILSVFNLTWVL